LNRVHQVYNTQVYQKGLEMDDFFLEPDQVLLPPQDVRLDKLEADLWPDRQRLHIFLEFTPFQKRPNADIKLYDSHEEELGSALIIENVSRCLDFNMHFRYPLTEGRYTLRVIVYYEEQYEKLSFNRQIELLNLGEINLNEDPLIVDRREITIEIG